MGNDEKIWKKNCPQCGKELFYTRKDHFNDAIEKNRCCQSCGNTRYFNKKDKYVWKCPTCNREIKCKNVYDYTKRIKGKHSCIECGKLKKKIKMKQHWNDPTSKFNTSEFREKWENARKNVWADPNSKNNSEEFRQNIKNKICELWQTPSFREKQLSILKSPEYKLKQQTSSINKWKSFTYRTKMEKIFRSDEFREKMRKRTLDFIRNKTNGKLGGYNKKACDYINKLNEKNKWNLQHSLNGGEYEIAGYLVDGYDKNKNIIFEYDERHHYDIYGKLKERDLYRQNIILKRLNPIGFWRYNEESNVLHDVVSGKEML